MDGNAATRWGSAYADPQWISVDLGTTYAINRVRLAWETAHARAYQVRVSPDNVTWSPVHTTTTGDGGVDDLTVSGTLLSQGRPVTASSVEPDSAHVAANAVDGNAATRWGSAYADPQWISVDLGASRSLDRVRLTWEAAYARAYQVQVSTDNVTWSPVHATTTGDGGVDDLPISATGRYLRVQGTQRALPAYGYSLWELEVHGS